jgi:uncharacterized membrane protein
LKEILLYLQAIFYILAGINHFRKEWFYLKMMPDYFPEHKQFVFWSGVAEIVLGIGLIFSVTRVYSAWGIIVLLIAVFPANLYMLTSGKFKKMPLWALILRLPLQFLLICWAFYFTK